jgi:hypothetical protein
MSSARDEDETGDVPGMQSVGYCSPPAEHRFRKGQSGNPNGRPRGARPKKIDRSFGAQPANQLLMDEAYRPVVLREGDKIIELPAIQAVFRAMGVSAMKGNRFAQRTIAQLVRSVEDEEFRLRSELMQSAIDYKHGWEQNFEIAKERGLPEPTPLPHPDDVIIDLKNGSVRWAGPRTPEEKADWDRLIQRRDEAQKEVTSFAERHKKARSPKMKALWLQEWHYEQKMFDIINDKLPPRYQVRLTGRSWAKGASRAGDHTVEKTEARNGRRRRSAE